MDSRWNMVRIQVESDWTRIRMDLSEFGRNGQNLVGVQVKFGWVLTDMIFLPNSDHSYHSAWNPLRFHPDPGRICGGG